MKVLAMSNETAFVAHRKYLRCPSQLSVVEMQMAWTDAFKQRVLFNASKAYVSQAEMGCKYEDLQPVYSLKIVSAFTAEELRAYDKFWDRVSSEKN